MRRNLVNYAYWQLPETDRCIFMAQTDGEPEQLKTVADLDGRSGWVMAPFEPSADCPILLMHPDVVEELPTDGPPTGEAVPSTPCDGDRLRPESQVEGGADTAERQVYHHDFSSFHHEIAAGRFAKLVLSRRATVKVADVRPEQLFWKACRLYPHQFIALVSLRHAGTWLVATPEVLLSGNGDDWRTMALAGTMNAGGHRPADVAWSAKNVSEQQCVSSYIKEVLDGFARQVSSTGPYTTQAAHLLHLRTDFHFSLSDTAHLGRLLSALHPTPAVCGIPKEEARRFILGQESVERKYYSGFCGPLQPHGDTHLYVSLRCMEIQPDGCRLYAGGGLLPESREESEWLETQNKLQTMLRLL